MSVFIAANDRNWLAVAPGTNIRKAVERGIALAKKQHKVIRFELHDKLVTVHASSNLEKVIRDWLARGGAPADFDHSSLRDKRRQDLEAQLRNIPAMTLISVSGGLSRVEDKQLAAYAEHWARLMQAAMAAGSRLELAWMLAAEEADLAGRSSAFEARAMNLLTKHWTHGAALKAAYNSYRCTGN